MPHLKRRLFLCGTLALATRPAWSQSLVLSQTRSPSKGTGPTPTKDWHDVVENARALQQCRAIVIHRYGMPILTERFRGPALDQVIPIKSVSKTIVASLTGIAIDRGEIPSINSTLGDLAPNLIPRTADPKVPALTIENLITMQAGLERTSGPGYSKWITSGNWVEDALSRPMVATPGTKMLYSTGSYHVLGAILSHITGTSLLSLARYRIGRPLGISIPAWTRDPQGRYLGGNEMSMTIDGMIRFGELYLNGGLVGNNRVLSKDWVEQSQQPATRSMFSGLGYGYGWFLGAYRGTSYALARGYGGQIICIVPDLALTIAITSDPNRPARSHGYFGELMRLIDESILPAAIGDLRG